MHLEAPCPKGACPIAKDAAPPATPNRAGLRSEMVSMPLVYASLARFQALGGTLGTPNLRARLWSPWTPISMTFTPPAARPSRRLLLVGAVLGFGAAMLVVVGINIAQASEFECYAGPPAGRVCYPRTLSRR